MCVSKTLVAENCCLNTQDHQMLHVSNDEAGNGTMREALTKCLAKHV